MTRYARLAFAAFLAGLPLTIFGAFAIVSCDRAALTPGERIDTLMYGPGELVSINPRKKTATVKPDRTGEAVEIPEREVWEP